MQPTPGSHGHLPVLRVGLLPGGRWRRPGGRIGQRQLGTVAGRPPRAAITAGMAGGVEVPVTAEAHQHLDGGAGKLDLQLHRVKAAVEDHQRHLLVCLDSCGGVAGEPVQQATDLAGRDQVDVVVRCQPAHVHRGGPGVAGKLQAHDELVAPARHDRLAGRVPRGVVVEPPTRGALRITARPHRGIHRKHRWPGRKLSCQHLPQSLSLHLAMAQRGIQAAMPAAVDRLQGQVRQRHQPLGR
jgi:hypothetical protein